MERRIRVNKLQSEQGDRLYRLAQELAKCGSGYNPSGYSVRSSSHRRGIPTPNELSEYPLDL